jgi:hypothetical protein
MFQFTTYHNSDSFETLEEMIQSITEYGISLIEKSFDPKWDETTLTLQGTRAQFEKMFLEFDGDTGQSINIDEFMDALVPV